MISVITAAYNAEKYIGETIESVLSQTFHDWEYIIVDDGSTDKTREVVEKYLFDKRLKYYYQKNSGCASARNKAISYANGKYIAVLDADDCFYCEKLKKEYNFLENHPECIAVGTNADIIDKDGKYLYTSRQLTEWKDIKILLPKSPIFNSSLIFRREVNNEIIYNEDLLIAEDGLFINQLAQSGEVRNLKEVLVKYRLVPSAKGNRSNKDAILISKIINRSVNSNTLSKSDITILQKIHKKRSKNWEISNYYLRIGKVYIERNFQKRRAANNLFKSLLNYPLNGTAWFNLALLPLPESVIKRWKRHRGVY